MIGDYYLFDVFDPLASLTRPQVAYVLVSKSNSISVYTISKGMGTTTSSRTCRPGNELID